MAVRREQSQQQENPQQPTPQHSAGMSEQLSVITTSVPGLPPLPPYPPPPHFAYHSAPSTATITTPISHSITPLTHSTPSVTGLSTQDRIALHLQHSDTAPTQHRDTPTSGCSQPVSDKRESRTRKRVTTSHNPAPSSATTDPSLTDEDTIVSACIY